MLLTTFLAVAAGLRDCGRVVYNDELRSALDVTTATPARADADVGAVDPPVRRSGTRVARNQAHPSPRDTRQTGVGASGPSEDQPLVQTSPKERGDGIVIHVVL